MAELRLWLGSLFEGLLCSPCPNAFKNLNLPQFEATISLRISKFSFGKWKRLLKMKTSVWRISLWKRPTIPSNQTNAASVTMHPLTQAIYGNSGEKPNKCNQCDYVSSYASALRTHLKTHGGEKSNTCNKWDFTSLYASALRTHLKTHSEEKSNKSNQCDYATSRAGDLRTHLKIQWGKVKQMQTVSLCLS